MKTKALSLLFAALLPLAALAAVWQDPQTKVNYEYTVGSGVASVAEGSWDFAGSPDATGNITILSQITVDGQTYAVTRIGFQAFYGCEGLTDAAIPASIVSIGHNAFKGTAWYETGRGGRADRSRHVNDGGRNACL